MKFGREEILFTDQKLMNLFTFVILRMALVLPVVVVKIHYIMSENHKKICRAICPGAIRCNKSPLPGKGYCAEHEKEFSCVQCKQEIRDKGVNIRIGDKYTQQEGADQKRNLCWNC